MHSLHFTAESSSNGVLERDFTVRDVPEFSGHRLPAPITRPWSSWAMAEAITRSTRRWLGRARLLVNGCGFHVAVIDAPGHGDRPRTAHDEAEIAELFRARAAGEPEGPIVVRYNEHLAQLAVPEYRATLDALQELPEIGANGPVGYWGINMGTAIGIPFVAIEPRITAAVLGQHWPDVLAEKAKQITIPIEFDLQWDDEHITRDEGLALFDAFASKEKSLHVNSGKHKELPRFEADSAVRFFARHLGRAVSPAA